MKQSLVEAILGSGFQDLDRRTDGLSVAAFGSQDLSFRASINGHWVSGPRVSGPRRTDGRTHARLCIARFCHRKCRTGLCIFYGRTGQCTDDNLPGTLPVFIVIANTSTIRLLVLITLFLSVCRGPETRGPETQIPTVVEYFCFGDLLEPILKIWRFLLFFLALKMWSLCHFFFHKNHLYESYLIFCHNVA